MVSKHKTIKAWNGSDRPREKLLRNGRRALTDVELLAILIGTGSRNESAVDLSRRLLIDLDNDLNLLAQSSVRELCAHKGMGEAKALRIIAALELARRRDSTRIGERPLLANSSQVYEYLKHVFMDLTHEESWVIFLNTGRRVIRREMIGKGGNDYTPVDIKLILRYAIECGARYLIISHNHPSGSLKASKADIYLTDRLIAAGRVFEIELTDHVIFSDRGYFSFRDEGLIDS